MATESFDMTAELLRDGIKGTRRLAGSNGRVNDRVRVMTDPDAPPNMTADQTIVRRYSEQPSALVRDSVRNWRTGRIEAILRGEFDVIR